MKVLLTGSTGFIGRHVVDALKSQRINFATVGRRRGSLDSEHVFLNLLEQQDFIDLFNRKKKLTWFILRGVPSTEITGNLKII